MGVSGCFNLVKYLLVLINLVFWVVGILAVALAAWMIADPSFYFSMTQDEAKYYLGLYVFLACGALLVLVAFLGCCGAIKESQCMLITFFCIVLIGIVGEAAMVWWGASHGNTLELHVRNNVEATVRLEYDGQNTRTIAFDTIQNKLECCGANGPQDWHASRYSERAIQDSPKGIGGILGSAAESVINTLSVAVGGNNPSPFIMPSSCCRNQGELCEAGRHNFITGKISNVIFSDGCSEKVLNAIKDNYGIIIGAGIGILVLEILGLIFALILCLAIDPSDRYKA